MDYITNSKSEIIPEQYDSEINKSRNLELFEYLIDKMNTAYKAHFRKICEKIDRTKFSDMNLKEQCSVLKSLFTVFKCDMTYADLGNINSNKTAGLILSNKDITSLKNISIVNQSPTGLFRQFINLKTL